MSTKTSFKRVALVAVAALTIGGFSAVSAHAVTSGGSLALSATSTTQAGLAAAPTTATYTFTSGNIGDAPTVVASLTTKPTLSGLTSASIALSSPTTGTATPTVAASGQIFTVTSIATGVNTASVVVTITPDVLGTYVLTLTPNAGGSTAQTFTVNAGSSTTPFAVTAPGSATGNGTSATSVSQTAGTGNLVTIAPILSIAGVTAPTANFATVTGSTFSSASTVGSASVTGFTLDTPATTATVAAFGADTTTRLYVNTPTAGTVTVKYYSRTYSGGVATDTLNQTITITVTAVAGITYSYTTVGSATLTGTSISQEVSGATLATAVAGTNAESWTVSQKDSAGSGITTANSAAVTASIVGVGAVKINAGTSGGYATLAAGSAQVGSANVSDTVTVLSDGRAGTATVTITVNGVTVLSKTLTFYGAVAAISAVANKSVLGTNLAVANAATITATDAAGTLVPYVAVGKFSAVSSSTSVLLNSGSYAEDATTTYGGHGNYTATVTTGVLSASGQTATITYTYTSGTTVINAAPVAFTLGGSASTVTFAFDKTTYAPGTAAIITVTAKDSAGNPAASGTVVSANAITSNLAASGLPNTALLASQNGVATLKVFAPGTAGTWIITDASNVITGGAVTATASVTADGTLAASIQAALDAANAAADAAAEATDAANAATDAANAAADAADSATAAAQDAADQAGQALAAVNTLATSVAVLIAGIKAQLTSVTNLVIKLIKRVAKLPIKK
jgi:hypothetical protein